MKFPLITKNIHYLDNAATTQKPKIVIDTLTEFYKKHNSNVHRGIYSISERATEMLENARNTFAQFINAQSEEIIFVKSATEGFNQLASSLGIFDTKNVVITDMEHHSNFVPWQQLSRLRIAKCIDGEFHAEDILKLMDENTSVVSMTGMSNTTGYIPDIKDIIRQVRQKNPNTRIIIDATQLVAHQRVDVKKLGADFICFSAHKVYGTFGVGIVWGRKELLENMEPFFYGGHMIKEVTLLSSTWADLPAKFEAGTIDAAGIIASAEGIKYFMTEFEKNMKKEEQLQKYALKTLKTIEGLKIVGHNNDTYGPIISFTIEGIHPHDLSTICNRHNVCLRAGQHCTHPLLQSLGINSTARISISFYNTKKDIDTLITAINEAKKILR